MISLTTRDVATIGSVDELRKQLQEFKSSEAERAAQVDADISRIHHEVTVETAKRVRLEACINTTLEKYRRWLIALSITTGVSMLSMVLLLIYVLSMR